MSSGNLNIFLNLFAILLSGGVLGVILKYRHGMASVASTSSADIRDHYAEELSRVVERQRQCEVREEQLRTRVAQLENDVLGLIRIIRQASADKVLNLTEEVSDTIREMAERVSGRQGTTL